ncbi:MAG: hypothetical protein JST39_04375 [Bacteroidetes bacterium]|nr:hypothetical protein [Bacteroidota bacterium]
MKINSTILKGGVMAILTATVLFSCKKDNKNSDDDTTASLSSSAASSGDVYDDTYDVSMQYSEDNGLSGGRVSTDAKVDGCATVTLSPADTVTYPKTMTIDFGTGCTSTNGITRKGKLVITLTGKVRKAGSVLTVAFNNYYVNGYKVEGTFSITNNSTANGLVFTTKTTDGKVTFPSGDWFSHSGTKTFTQTAGYGTATFTDDAWSITGTFSNANSAGRSVSGTIGTALVKLASCKNIVSGTILFVYNGIKGTLDYGSGTCDNAATVTVGTKSYPVTLPR